MNCVVLRLYDQFMTHHESHGFEPNAPKRAVEESEILENAAPRLPWVPEGFFSFGVLYKIPSHFEGKKNPSGHGG